MGSTRRNLLQNMGYAAALFGVPASAASGTIPPLPDRDLFLRDPEAFWKRIRDEQFLLPGWRAFLNNGSLGVAPKPVLAAVQDYLDRSAELRIESGYPRWGYETLDEFRTELAQFFGCKKEELALTHNATEAMCIVGNGLDLKPGDEVLMTDQEHTGGKGVWKMRQARHGITVREVPIPLPPRNPEQLVDLMVSAIGSRTRGIMFSGITSPTGLVMPIRQICEAARAKGVISVIDGAHVHGQIPFKYSELGCDFMTGSPHKWVFAPAGCGMLYIREEMLDRLYREQLADLVIISDDKRALSRSQSPIQLPDGIPEWLTPIISIIPAQLFAYHLSRIKGLNPENPRTIRKVTETN